MLGAGAFLMAEITGIPYGEIAFAAIIPCILFYIACFMHVELHARNHGLQGLPRSELPPLGRDCAEGLPVHAARRDGMRLADPGFSAFRAGTLGIVAAIAVSWLSPRSTAIGPAPRIAGLRIVPLRDVLQLVAVCACAGIVVGVIGRTGIGGRFSSSCWAWRPATRSLAMLFAMLVATHPRHGHADDGGLCHRGRRGRTGPDPHGRGAAGGAHVHLLLRHPLGDHAAGGAGLLRRRGMAKADPWRTACIALKLGLATFIVPFMFFVSPLLLAQGDLLPVLGVLATASLGVVMLACATEGWLAGAFGLLPRALLLAGAVCLIVPEPITDALGLGLWMAAFASYWTAEDVAAMARRRTSTGDLALAALQEEELVLRRVVGDGTVTVTTSPRLHQPVGEHHRVQGSSVIGARGRSGRR